MNFESLSHEVFKGLLVKLSLQECFFVNPQKFQEFVYECLIRMWDAVEEIHCSMETKEYVEEELRKFTEGFAYKPKENNDKKRKPEARAIARSIGHKSGASKKTVKKSRGKNGQKDQKNRKRDEKGRFLPKNA